MNQTQISSEIQIPYVILNQDKKENKHVFTSYIGFIV